MTSTTAHQSTAAAKRNLVADLQAAGFPVTLAAVSAKGPRALQFALPYGTDRAVVQAAADAVGGTLPNGHLAHSTTVRVPR